jgi:hypothetical protein
VASNALEFRLECSAHFSALRGPLGLRVGQLLLRRTRLVEQRRTLGGMARVQRVKTHGAVKLPRGGSELVLMVALVGRDSDRGRARVGDCGRLLNREHAVAMARFNLEHGSF